MNHLALIALLSVALAGPAAAQPMDHASMPGMSMPMAAPAKPTVKAKTEARRVRVGRPTPTAAKRVSPFAGDQVGQDMAIQMPEAVSAGTSVSSTPGMTMVPTSVGTEQVGMKGMDMSKPNQSDSELASMPDVTEPEIPITPPPPPPKDYAAERFFNPAAMAAARATLREEHGGTQLSKVMANLAEYQARSGGGYRWDGQAWFGGDINRFVLKSEGEGSRRAGLDGAEVQALYSRTISPYFNLQTGVRQDFKPHSRTYVTVGVDGLAPYWFDVGAALFLSSKGELLGRLEGTYDLRLTQRLILQPRVELNLAAQDTREARTGSGLSNAELGLRLRYEIKREFAPYIGVSYDRRFGKTGDYVRAIGEDVAVTSFVAGVRAWF